MKRNGSLARGGFKRTERLNDQIRMEVADILAMKVKDPRIGFVTVTAVQVSPDLRQAKVFVSFLDPNEAAWKNGIEGLTKAAPYIRGELGRRIHTRYTPEVHFLPDHSAEEAERVIKILDELGGTENNEP